MSAWIQRAFSASAGAGPPSISAATAGSLLIVAGTYRSQTMNLGPSGWTLVEQRAYSGDYIEVWSKTAVGGETTVPGVGIEFNGMLAEYPAGATVRDSDSTVDTSLTPDLTPSLTLGTIVENDHVVAVIGCGLADGAFDSAASAVSYTPGAGWTEHVDFYSSSGHPVTWIADQDAPASVPITATATINKAPGLDNDVYYVWGMVMVAVSGEAPPPPEPGIILSINDVDITDAQEKIIRVEWKGVGQGSFKINRHSAQATATNLTQGNVVKVTYPRISPDPIFAFFLETGDFDLVSTDEEGGEMLSFAGRGVRSLLGRAVMWSQSYLSTTKAILGPVQKWVWTKSGSALVSRESVAFPTETLYDIDLIESLAYTPVPSYPTRVYGRLSSGPYSGKYVNQAWFATPYAGVGAWKLWAFGRKPGNILYQIIAEAQAASRPQHPLAAMTIDFTSTTDSNGDAWNSADETFGFIVQIGENLDDIAQRLVDTGTIDLVMDPDLVLHAYNAYGRDLHSTTFATDKVRFAKGYGIADILTRSRKPELPATHVLVDGDDDLVATAVLADAGDRPTVEIYAALEGSDSTALADAGLGILEAGVTRLESAIFKIAVDEDPVNGLYLPGPEGTNGHFWIGDLVTLWTGATTLDYINASVNVAAVTIGEVDAGNLDVTPELVGTFHDYRRQREERYGRFEGFGATSQGRGVLPGRVLTRNSPTEVTVQEGTLVPGFELDVTAADVAYDNATSGLAADDVQAALDEIAAGAGLDALNAAVFGYQAHGNLGSTETFDSTAAGWHSGTVNADCTFTFTAATSGTVSSMVLELTQDGTGGWALTLPGSVVGDFSGYDTTAGTTSLLMFFSRDGGTTWFGFIAGGSGAAVAALDDLTDVTITSATVDDDLRFNGSVWVNDARHWEPVTDNPGAGPEIVFDGDNIVMEFA